MQFNGHNLLFVGWLIFCFGQFTTHAQEVESLRIQITEAKEDTIRIDLLNALAKEYAYHSPEQADSCASLALQKADKSSMLLA